MKKIRTYNHYNNGSQSRLNVYFEDGTEIHRQIESCEVTKLAHEGEKYLRVLLEKYKEPQPWAKKYTPYGVR